ncbi:zeta toxin [Rhizobium sp. PP-F2F-G48]|uniref:zeta toxin family protein n=1 Tax=Rhizobium sp. PP-F2F-G48 TaxID=2135651 RepID=UPI0010471E7E|nr:zeta toxin family protein [Rhizobium sp. PP-F2F-G48]TCM51105.1 zeta toxin [Rhizobium sp. PP-F2F-G48]
MPEPRETHILTPAENERIFRADIAPDYLPGNLARAERPTLIVLGGQPGAGKTAILTSSQRELAETGPAVRIVGDDLRAYHPSFAVLQRRDAETASQFTQADAGRWTEKLLAEALKAQVHVVFETTMRTPEAVANIMKLGREAGYCVEARAVAVHPRVSWQGCHYRFEEMQHAGEPARMPPREVHDAGVGGVVASLNRIEAEKLADRIQIRLRTGDIVYDNTLEAGQWRKPAEAAAVMERERGRPLVQGAIQRFADDWSHVLARMAERAAPDEKRATVEFQAKEDVAHFRTQRRDADMMEGRTRGRFVMERAPDALALFVELFENAVRDASRRPIGNVEAHAAGRLAQTYTALKLVEVARGLGLLPEDGKFIATRALVQDKRASREFPAAHRMPADLAVETGDGARTRLTDLFTVPLNRIAIDREVFAPTDRMSRIANVADAWMEGAGMRASLARGANAVASGVMSAGEAMTRIVEPGYREAAGRAQEKLERNVSVMERAALSAMIVDGQGQPARQMREDLRLRAQDITHRATTKAMLGQVLSETVRQDRLDPSRQREMDELVTGVADNERKLGAGYQLRPSGERVPTSGVLIPARELPDLTEGEIGHRLDASARLEKKRGEIERLARLVYGENSPVASVTRQIGSASQGAAVAEDVRTGKLGPLAGEGGGWFRSESPERQTAKAHAPQLAAALADYGQTIEFERHQVLTAHREEQHRQRKEVKAPSATLAEVLEARPDDQSRRLRESPDLRSELSGLMLALNRRLSSEERSALLTGDVGQMSKTLGVAAERVAGIRLVQVRGSQAQRQMQNQNQVQQVSRVQAAQNLSLKR